MGEIRNALKLIVGSGPYKDWAEAHSADANKVSLELGGRRRPDPRDRFALGLVRLARLDPPQSAPTSTTPPPASALNPLWSRDGVFTRTLSSFHGELRDAALAAGFSWVAVQLDGTDYAAANEAELRAIGVGLRSRGWSIVGWGPFGLGQRGARGDGYVHARITHELGLDGWIANGEDWAEGSEIGDSAAYIAGFRSYGAPPCPLAVSCLSSTTSQWARAFDYASWLAQPGVAIMPQVYGASHAGYTIANMLSTMGLAHVPTTRLAPTFDVIGGSGPFGEYAKWKGPRSVWTGDDSVAGTWAALRR